MSILLHGDCLEEMKGLDDNSIDLIFCDLPYGQTSCKWDCCIDLEKFWIEVMRIKKLNTPIFMTTTTKFGVSLINSCPKKCPFRYDICYIKSSCTGFLSAKKMPMRKHEMIYVFYEKLPFYDLSSHTHKFIKETEPSKTRKVYGKGDGKNCGSMFDKDGKSYFKSGKETQNKYDPPLPVSIVKEETGGATGKELDEKYKNKGGLYSKVSRNGLLKAEPHYDPPLPVSIVKEDIRKDKHETAYGENIHHHNNQQRNGESIYNPPLPNSMLEIKSTRGKHSTEKPVALMEWVLKYYSKEGDTILDPTMGSGSTGVACKNMNRNFIGIEMDDEIYEVAVNRIED